MITGYEIATTSKQVSILHNRRLIGPKAEKSATEQMKYEGHAGCFLRLPKFCAFEFIRRGRTVSQEFYLTVFGRPRRRKKLPTVWQQHSWFLHH
jgi:hypothetical protein